MTRTASTLLAAVLLALGFAGPTRAEEGAPAADLVTAFAEAGWLERTADGGGETLSPYEDLDSHLLGSASLDAFLSWGTMGMSLGYAGSSYYDLGMSFNYKGAVDFRVKSSAFPRNFEHLALPPSTPYPAYLSEDLDPDDGHGVDFRDSEATLKVRTPGYPAHLRLGVRRFEAEGVRQQVFLDENCATMCHNVSRSRPIDSRTTEARVGADAHLGLVDLSYDFKALDFRDDGAATTWQYGPTPRRAVPGVRPVDPQPDINVRDHTVTLSSLPTSRLAATAGFGVGERENLDADLTADYSTVTGSAVWRPAWGMIASLRYNRYRYEEQEPGPETLALRRLGGLPDTLGSTRESLYATLTARPFKWLRLRGEARRLSLERDESEAWQQPPKTVTESLRISAQLRPHRTLTVDASYRDQWVDDVALRAALTDSSDGSLSLTWQPAAMLLLQAGFSSLQGERRCSPDREEDRLRFNASATVSPWEAVTLSLLFTSFDDDVTADLDLVSSAFLPGGSFLAPGSTYRARGDHVTFQAGWRPRKDLEFQGGLSFIAATGEFMANNAALGDIGGYSRLDAVQREITLSASWDVGAGWGLTARWGYANYDDRIDDAGDEIVRDVAAVVTRKW